MEELLKQLLKGQEQITNRLDRIESAMVTKADMNRLENKVGLLESKIEFLENKIDLYGQIQQNDVYHLLKLTSKKIEDIHEDMKSIAEVTGEHEIKIRTLSRRPV